MIISVNRGVNTTKMFNSKYRPHEVPANDWSLSGSQDPLPDEVREIAIKLQEERGKERIRQELGRAREDMNME